MPGVSEGPWVSGRVGEGGRVSGLHGSLVSPAPQRAASNRGSLQTPWSGSWNSKQVCCLHASVYIMTQHHCHLPVSNDACSILCLRKLHTRSTTPGIQHCLVLWAQSSLVLTWLACSSAQSFPAHILSPSGWQPTTLKLTATGVESWEAEHNGEPRCMTGDGNAGQHGGAAMHPPGMMSCKHMIHVT